MTDQGPAHERSSHQFVCSADTVREWAEIAQDRNPLHLDPEFAAKSAFGTPIGHGHLLACLVADQLQRTVGSAMTFSVRFKAPVPVGSDVYLMVTRGERPREVAVAMSCDGVEPLGINARTA